MKAERFHFVDTSISPANKKAYELAKSEARAHAARISYPRPKPANHTPVASSEDAQLDNLKHSPPESDEQCKTTPPGGKPKKVRNARGPKAIRFRVHMPGPKTHGQNKRSTSSKAHSREIERPASPQRQRNRSWTRPTETPPSDSEGMMHPVQLFKSISKSMLDPFFRPAADLSVPDSHLLHDYFKRVPYEIFGTTSSPLSKTVQGGAYEGMATNEIQLMWCLIAMESQGLSFQQTDTERQLSILSRRNYVYNLMKTKLADEKTAQLTPFVLSVAMAATIEKRLGNEQHARYHTRGLKKILDLRGGPKAIRDMQYPFGLMVFNILIEVGLPDLFDYQGLLRKLPQMRLKLRDLQAWNHQLLISFRSENTQKQAAGSSQPSFSHSRTRHIYAFGRPALKDYIEIPPGKLTEAEYRFYLAMLYAVNNALWAFRNKPKASDMYLDTLADASEMSSSRGFILQCFGAKLPSLLLLLMIAHYVAHSEGLDPTTEAVFADEEAFEFVELMMLASPESRDVVLKALWSWLTSETATDFTCLSNSKLDILLEEIEDKWLETKKG